MRALTIPATLAAAAVLAACGGGEPPLPAATAAPATGATPPATDEPPVTETPAMTETGPATTETAPAGTEPEPPEAGPTAAVSLEGGEPAGGAARIEVTRGDTVTIRIRSDSPEEIHVHGYDLTLAVGPGQPATLSFVAELEGIFALEAHGSGAHVAELVVRP